MPAPLPAVSAACYREAAVAAAAADRLRDAVGMRAATTMPPTILPVEIMALLVTVTAPRVAGRAARTADAHRADVFSETDAAMLIAPRRRRRRSIAP